ncbi:hypothetical protein H310_04499 [Aphanomyces invadans]|uniref:Tubulin delta chain n=1 Tax=Aphanomyces invadans TaxID=157072 RepID=A0A024UES8_9STRA|nr:hypothetical protein H310_04499 [Aphanomyces invadans]ETW04143.1 hypothetical protein H310_04499 [Aphanomyces invadans]|eukprot:XP_008867099.1 hypothetical protein H310_04499 [Aphanomyces invadans]
MSVVTLQLGQCGNQVGLSFFDKLSTELQHFSAEDRECFFRSHDSKTIAGHDEARQRATARAVLIDMEPKVVNQCFENAGRATGGIPWQYDAANIVCEQSGSGNNWAYGYAVHGTGCHEGVLDVVRKEVERCDYFKGFLALQSLAGGTGSGLGSYVCDSLRELYPSSYLLNSVVWPYRSGEVIVQNYNTLLTMACLSESSDGMLILENDLSDQICQRLLAIPAPSFAQMNQVLANHLAAVLLPVLPFQKRTHSSRFSSCALPSILQHLCAHPGYKLLNVKLVPQLATRSREFSAHQWPGVLKHLHQMHIANSGMDEGVRWDVSLDNGQIFNKSVASMLFLRGPHSDQLGQVDPSAFRDSRLYTSWSMVPFTCMYHPLPFSQYDKTAALLSNCQAMLPQVEAMLEKAHHMFTSNAYVHQYAAHGVEADFFRSCFLRLDQMVVNYKAM